MTLGPDPEIWRQACVWIFPFVCMCTQQTGVQPAAVLRNVICSGYECHDHLARPTGKGPHQQLPLERNVGL